MQVNSGERMDVTSDMPGEEGSTVGVCFDSNSEGVTISVGFWVPHLSIMDSIWLFSLLYL